MSPFEDPFTLPTGVNPFEWLMRGKRGGKWAVEVPCPCPHRTTFHDNSGDQAGSDAKAGVGTFCSFRPVTSTVYSEGPALPPGSRKNITTRPFGAKVGPSLW